MSDIPKYGGGELPILAIQTIGSIGMIDMDRTKGKADTISYQSDETLGGSATIAIAIWPV